MKRCLILLPVFYNNGKEVPPKVMTGILREIDDVFDGHTVAGKVTGRFRMGDGRMAEDESIQVWVAVDEKQVHVLKEMTSGFARTLKQESIYFEVMNSEVEFIGPNPESEGA